MSDFDEGFGPCDCGEVELWTGNAEIRADEDGVRIRHSRYVCRPVKPTPQPTPAPRDAGKE